jgi:iron complex transport system substrate-binding protein
MHRIVSLIASATEIVCGLGFRDQLVGRSHECDFPASVKELPVCTEPKFNVEGSSYDIDARVKAIVQEGLSVYRIHADIVQRLRPTVIVTQTQCEVCAVSLADVERALADWLSDGGTRIVSLSPNQLSDVWADINQVAGALSIPDTGRRLVGELQERMGAISQRVASSASVSSNRPSVACIEWIDPLMAAGNWMPELVELAGGMNLFGEAGKHAPWMTLQQLCARDPEVIIVVPCGFDIPRSRGEMAILSQRREWPKLRAVRNKRVYLADGNQYFNRPGPRLVESLEILAEIFHPDVFRLGHEGTGWQKF